MKRIKVRGKEKRYIIIDDVDYGLVSQHRWWYGGGDGVRKYVSTLNNGKTLYIHRLIMKPPKGMYVDHINGNQLDNRRQNLRIVDQSHNNANFRKMRKGKSQYKGVSWCKFTNKWRVRVKLYGKEVYSKRFDSEVEAAKMYNKFAKEIFGEHAYLNKIKTNGSPQNHRRNSRH